MTDLPSGDIVASVNYLRNPPTDDPAIPMLYDAIGRDKTTMRLAPDTACTRRVPHTALVNSLVGPETPTRSSIETRVVAYF